MPPSPAALLLLWEGERAMALPCPAWGRLNPAGGLSAAWGAGHGAGRGCGWLRN